MPAQRARALRRWPIWLLLSAFALLIAALFWMQQGYRAQVAESMRRLQRSTAAAQAHQEQLAAQLRATAPERLGIIGGPSVHGAATSAQPAAPTAPLAVRLDAVSSALESLAEANAGQTGSRQIGSAQLGHATTPPRDHLGTRSPAANDGTRWPAQVRWVWVRTELRGLNHLLQQRRLSRTYNRYRTDPVGQDRRSGRWGWTQQQALSRWLQQAGQDASQESSKALARSLAEIDRLLSAEPIGDHIDEQLRRRLSALRQEIAPASARLGPSERQIIEALADETAEIAQQLRVPDPRSPVAKPLR